MDDIEIRRFAADDRAWLIDQHQAHYGSVEGFDDSFGVLVAEIVDDFLTGHDSAFEAGWIAWRGEARLGSIFCVRVNDSTAKLRLFLLIDEVRGTGLGHRMLETCMGYARDRAYRQMQLWTHESHRAAGALYARTGWHLMSSKPVVSFGQPLVEQHWRITL